MRQPGDVLAGLPDHVGIVSDDSNSTFGQSYLVFSASSLVVVVVLNNWSTRMPDARKYDNAAEYNKAERTRISSFTVRRFNGA